MDVIPFEDTFTLERSRRQALASRLREMSREAKERAAELSNLYDDVDGRKLAELEQSLTMKMFVIRGNITTILDAINERDAQVEVVSENRFEVASRGL